MPLRWGTINRFLAAAIGFSVVDLLNTHAKGVKLAPFFVALVSLCFSMTAGVLWEFFEFVGDRLAGALVFSALGYLYIFRRDQYRFAESLLIIREPVQTPGPE